jgi:hypothetical protein
LLKKEKRKMIAAGHIGKAAVHATCAVCETLPKKPPLQAICMLEKEELAQ